MNAEEVRIFLCYAREDISVVKVVYQKLFDAGYYPWMDKKDLLPGQNWRIETPKALRAARFVIIFFSKHSVSKEGYVQREFKLALDTLEEKPEGKVYIIPVRLDECEVPDSFGHIHYSDLFEEDGLGLVLKTIKNQLEGQTQSEEVGIQLEEHQKVLKELEEQKKQFKKERKKVETEKRQALLERRLREQEEEPWVIREEPDLSSLDKFVKIPDGSFQMGSETGDDQDKPVHSVRISNPFYMSKYLVTQEQWEAVMGENPSHFNGKNLPVETVSWDDVQEFIRRLNQKMEREIFRLPTEAEWEYACRAGTASDYAGILNDMAWYNSNSNDQTHRVGTKQPNAWGLYDMHGNVWEWCQDWYDYYSIGGVSDPTGPTRSQYGTRIVRGGGWHNDARSCRSAARNSYKPGNRYGILGFRLVRIAK